MSTNVGEIDLSLILNSDQFRNQLRNLPKETDKAANMISSSLGKIGAVVATVFSVSKIIQFGKACVDVATETANAWIGLNSILVGQGKSFDKAKSFIQDYISDGLVPLNNAVAAYKNLSLRGYNSDQIEKTMTALKNSATFARQSTYSLGDAVQTATEGLKNENSVVVDNAGVTKNVAKMWEEYAASIGKTTNQLTQQEKIQAEVNGILEETKFQSNDAAKYANTYSGAVARLSSAFTNMKIAIGNVIQPIAKLFIPMLTAAANAVTRLFTALAGLLSLFGLKADSVETVSGGLEGVAQSADNASGALDKAGKSADKAGKSASKAGKKAKGSLASWDELNVLSNNNNDDDSSGGSGGGSAGGGAGALTDSLDVTSTIEEDTSVFDGLIARLKELANIFKDGFMASWGDTNFDGIFNHLNSIKQTLKDIWTDPEVVGAANNWCETLMYTLGQKTGAIARIGVNIAEFFVGSIDTYLLQNVDRIKAHIINMFDISSQRLKIVGNFYEAIGKISDVFKSDKAKQIGADIIAIFVNPIMSVKELLAKLERDLTEVFLQPIIDNAEKIKTSIENTLTPLQTLTGTLSEAFTYIGDKCNEVYDSYLKPFFDSLSTGLSDTFGKFLDVYNEYIVPFLQNLADGFSNLWDQHLKPMVDSCLEIIGSIVELLQVLWENCLKPLIDWIIQNVVPAVVNVLDTVWKKVSTVFASITDTLTGIINALKGVIDFLIGVFTGDWNRAWEGIKEIFNGIWEAMKGIVDTAINTIKGIVDIGISLVKNYIDTKMTAAKDIFTRIWDKMKSVAKTTIDNMKDFISKGLDAISTAFSNVFNGILNVIKGVCNSILSGIETMVNGVINGINAIINAFNGLNIDIPDWVPGYGGKKFGFSIPNVSPVSLPRLANGGYVKANSPQLAIVGDNRTQGEITAPEDKIQENVIVALEEFFRRWKDNKDNKDDQPPEIHLHFDGELSALAQILKPYLDDEDLRKGKKLVLGGT